MAGHALSGGRSCGVLTLWWSSCPPDECRLQVGLVRRRKHGLRVRQPVRRLLWHGAAAQLPGALPWKGSIACSPLVTHNPAPFSSCSLSSSLRPTSAVQSAGARPGKGWRQRRRRGDWIYGSRPVLEVKSIRVMTTDDKRISPRGGWRQSPRRPEIAEGECRPLAGPLSGVQTAA